MQELIDWAKPQYSDLPWRKKRTMYRTLVSEIMLQQTTVGTVLNHFERFLKIYPNIKTLAASTEEEVCINWKGLGYYRRARNLRKAAIFIEENYSGRIPRDYDKLIAIPGIGDYTASALLAMGADQSALCLDANLERVLSRLYGIQMEKGPKLLKHLRAEFESGAILSDYKEYSARDLNEAIMDLGRTICQARKADCSICPLASNCVAATKDPLKYPSDKKKIKKYFELNLLRIVVKKKDKILVYKKNQTEWLAGQYELPTFIISTEDKKLNQYPVLRKKISFQTSVKSGITKYKIINGVIELTKNDFKKFKFPRDVVWKQNSTKENLTSTTLKILKKLNN